MSAAPPQVSTDGNELRRKERVSMAREICSHRGENPGAVDRRGIEGWEKYEPLAGACIREAERLFALRGAAQAETMCCKGLAPASECQCEIERKAAGFPPYYRGQPTQGGNKGDIEGARISRWLADYSHDLMEGGDFDQEAAKLAEAAQWIADRISGVAYASRNVVIEECAKIAETAYSRMFPKPTNRITAENAGHAVAAAIRALSIPSTPCATPRPPLNAIQFIALLEILEECAEHVTPELEARIKNVLGYHTDHDTVSSLPSTHHQDVAK